MMKALIRKHCLFLVALGVTLLVGESARSDWFYDFNNGTIPSSLKSMSWGNGYTLNGTLSTSAQGGYLTLKDKTGLPYANGGTMEGDVYNPEVFTGDVMVTATINVSGGTTNDYFGLGARNTANTTNFTGYWAYMSFGSWQTGKLVVGKNVGSTANSDLFATSNGSISNKSGSYFLKLSVINSPITGYPTVTGDLYAYEGGPVLLETSLVDTNLGGISPWKSGVAMAWATPDASPNSLNATFDNIRAVSVPEPGTLLLLSVGTTGLLALAWRRRKRAA
jgi:hypothetical protein